MAVRIEEVKTSAVLRYFGEMTNGRDISYIRLFINALNTDFVNKLPGDITARFYKAGGQEGYYPVYMGRLDHKSSVFVKEVEAEIPTQTWRSISPMALIRVVSEVAKITDVTVNFANLTFRPEPSTEAKGGFGQPGLVTRKSSGIMGIIRGELGNVRSLAVAVGKEIISPNEDIKIRGVGYAVKKSGLERVTAIVEQIDLNRLAEVRARSKK